jgi:hypothetical protein
VRFANFPNGYSSSTNRSGRKTNQNERGVTSTPARPARITSTLAINLKYLQYLIKKLFQNEKEVKSDVTNSSS